MGLMRKVEIKGKELRKGREIIWMGDIYVEIYEVPFLLFFCNMFNIFRKVSAKFLKDTVMSSSRRERGQKVSES